MFLEVGMRLARTGKPTNYYYYVIETYRNEEGKQKTRTVEALGSANVIKEKYNVEDAEKWCQEYIKAKNKEIEKNKKLHSRELTITLYENKKKPDCDAIFNFGYLVLEQLYYSFGLNKICNHISSLHPKLEFDLNNVLKTMLFGRILFPSSKLRLIDKHQKSFLEARNIQTQHIYRALDLLNENNNIIQEKLFEYSSSELPRDVSSIYYDCTNFYTETETEDCDIVGMSEEWYSNHTLRKYGKSKENRPNPIVQMGLFMDRNGIPLGFCINPGNTNEQITMLPLEKQLLNNFPKADIIVCTDGGLASDTNRKFNNKDKDDYLVRLGLCGQRHFITTQSVKKLKSHLKDWVLDTTGWAYQTTNSYTGKKEIINGIDLSILDNEDLYTEHFNTIFYKERTVAENGLDSRLIVTYSLKYKTYLENIRTRKVKRAEKMIENGTFDRENDNSPKKFIEKNYKTKDGEIANKKTAVLSLSKIQEDALFDGFYAVSTNIFKDEMTVQEIAQISSRRWEIEESFRIMKTDLKSRPFYHNKDSRIVAHFQTCFMSLLLLRGIEYKLNIRNKDIIRFPNAKYTVNEILDALKELKVVSLKNGFAFKPEYTNSAIIKDLLKIFSLEEFGHEIVMSDTVKKILKKIQKKQKSIK